MEAVIAVIAVIAVVAWKIWERIGVILNNIFKEIEEIKTINNSTQNSIQKIMLRDDKFLFLQNMQRTLENIQKDSETKKIIEKFNTSTVSETSSNIEKAINKIINTAEQNYNDLIKKIEEQLSHIPESENTRKIRELLQNQSREFGELRESISSNLEGLRNNLTELRYQQKNLTHSINVNTKGQSDYELMMVIYGDEVARIPDIVSKNLTAILDLHRSDANREEIAEEIAEEIKKGSSIEQSKIEELVDFLLDSIAPEAITMLSNHLKTELKINKIEDLEQLDILKVYKEISKGLNLQKKLDSLLEKLGLGDLRSQISPEITDKSNKFITKIIQSQKEKIKGLIETRKISLSSPDPELVAIKRDTKQRLERKIAGMLSTNIALIEFERELENINKWLTERNIHH